MSKPSDLVQGTLDLLVLKILALGEQHGWAISQRLKEASGDELQVSVGSLYPALHKLELAGLITAEWKTSELGRRAKFYSLTRSGRRHLEKEKLAAELLWLLFLFPSSITGATKRKNVVDVWAWYGNSLDPNHTLLRLPGLPNRVCGTGIQQPPVRILLSEGVSNPYHGTSIWVDSGSEEPASR
jgi:transcriptional regulator